MCINFKYVASHSLQINVKDVPGICNLEKSFFDDNDFNRKTVYILLILESFT